MITEDMVLKVQAVYNINASRAEIRRVLEAFERMTNASKPAVEVKPGEMVFVSNAYAGDEDEFTTVEGAIEHIQEYAEKKNWEESDIDDNFKVIIGRGVTLNCEKTLTIKFS